LPRSILPFLVAIGVLSGGATADDRPRPGQTPTDRDQIARITAARGQLAAALRKADAPAIADAEAAFRHALGPFAGVAESPERPSAATSAAVRPSADDLRTLTRRMGRLGSGSDEARANRMELRNAAYLAIGLLALAQADAPDAAAYRRQAAVELDWLIARQTADGYFPYPADPVAPPHLQRQAARAARDNPDKLRDGYIHLDADGAQFDTGCAAYALAYGHQILREPRFLVAARRAGDWALGFPLSPNWNYNAFSVWQLAKLYEATREPKYLQGAIRTARLGVLPGQLQNGRWSDQHNARAVYHWIMVRGLVALLRVLPRDDPQATDIRARTTLAIQSRVDDMLRDGAGTGESALVALAEALEHFGPNRQWEEALAKSGGLSPYSAGVLARQRAAAR
jgi:hypothetical protein